MKQDTEMVRQTLSKIEGKVVSGLDLGKLDRGPRGAGGLGGLSSFGGGGGSGGGGGGGNPVPGKVFEELMIELAQIRKANAQLKTMIDKGSITTSSILTNSQHGGAMTPGQQGGMTLGRTSSAAGVAQVCSSVCACVHACVRAYVRACTCACVPLCETHKAQPTLERVCARETRGEWHLRERCF